MPILIIISSDAAALVARYQGAQAIVRGLIRRAIDEENLNATAAIEVGGLIRSTIGSNLVYAAAHEFGAKAHTIVARNAKALRFKPAGQYVFKTNQGFIFRKSVNIPALPARAPIKTGILECAENYGIRASALIRREFGRE